MLCPRARLSVSGVGGGHTSRGSPINPSPSLTLYIWNGWASSSSSMWGGTNMKALRSPGESGYHAKLSTLTGGCVMWIMTTTPNDVVLRYPAPPHETPQKQRPRSAERPHRLPAHALHAPDPQSV